MGVGTGDLTRSHTRWIVDFLIFHNFSLTYFLGVGGFQMEGIVEMVRDRKNGFSRFFFAKSQHHNVPNGMKPWLHPVKPSTTAKGFHGCSVAGKQSFVCQLPFRHRITRVSFFVDWELGSYR